MSKQSNIPKGCSATRGASDVPHLASLGGDMAKKANKLYMLNVRRSSLKNKEHATSKRLKETINQVKAIEKEMDDIEEIYNQLRGKESKKKRKNKSVIEEDKENIETRTMKINY